MPDKPLDELYFEWLFRQVGSEHKTHRALLEHLFCREFVWHIPNDDNRAVDGQDLRLRFLEEKGITNPPKDWMWLQCSVLEMLIALAKHMAFEADGEPYEWFWLLIKNLGLDQYKSNHRVPKEAIDEVLDAVIWRTYSPDGSGGLFPLSYPQQDQREVEIWYQMSAYLLETGAY